MNISEEVLMCDPALIAMIFGVSVKQTKDLFYGFNKKYGNCLSREERLNLTFRHVQENRTKMKKFGIDI